MKKIYSFLALVLFASLIASCSTDSSTNSNGGGGGTAPEGKMIVTINGKVDTLQPVTAVKNGNTYNVGAGNSSGESVTITTNGITASGNYTNALNTSGQIIAISYGNGAGSSYTATVTIGTANLNISQLSPNFIASFNGTLQLQSGTGASTMTIANGSVNGVVH